MSKIWLLLALRSNSLVLKGVAYMSTSRAVAGTPRLLLISPRSSTDFKNVRCCSSASAPLHWSAAATGESGRILASAGPLRRLQQVAGHISIESKGGLPATASASDAELSKVEIWRNGDGETIFDAYVAGSKGAPGILVIKNGGDLNTKRRITHWPWEPRAYSQVGSNVEKATRLYENLDWPGVIKDIAAAVKYLKEEGSRKGALSIASDALVPGIDAVVAFYGIPQPGLADVSKTKVPVQGRFGELDNVKGFSDVEAAKGLEATKAGVPWKVYIYDGVGRQFLNSSDEGIKRKVALGFGGYKQGQVNLAWSRFEAWFSKNLES